MGELTCILCGQDVAIRLDLADGDTFYCPDCDGDFSVSQVRETVGKWQRCLAWLDAMPREPTT